MSYSFKGRVRYSEIGEDGCLTLPGIQNYYQDCCTFQSEEIGQGMEVLEERQRAWVLSSWQIVVNRYPGLGETIVASTAPYGFKGFPGPILIQRPVCLPDLQMKTSEDTNWMKSWRWIMRPVRSHFRKGWKPRSLLQYRNIIWTPITMLIIASISAWGQIICQKAL